MLRKVPPLETIEIFVAAARSDSFRSVARDLALSPSAVSRRIAGLEAFLDVVLFERSGMSVRLNSAGRKYLGLVESAIGTIQQATSSMLQPEAESLCVATSHSFASCWLIPRLGDLRACCGIDIDILPVRDPAVLRTGVAELGVWGHLGMVDGLASEPLFEMQAMPVAAPAVAIDRGAITDAQLAQMTLLGVRWPAGYWERWFALGAFQPVALDVRSFSSLQLAYETAAAGSGAILAVPLLAEALLDQGKLVPIGASRRTGDAYQLYRSNRKPTGAHLRFLDWLRPAVAASVTRYEAIAAHRQA